MNTAIINKFYETVESRKSEIALIFESQELSFGELAEYIRKLGTEIFSKRNISRQIVAVLLPKSIDLVSIDLTVLSLGAAFMNLDCKLPIKRMEAICKHINPVMIITNSELIKKYGEVLVNFECINMDVLEKQDSIVEEFVDKDCELIDTDPFCVINTSGSTGIPKGVILNQRSFFDFVEWAQETYNFNDNIRMGCLTPVYFDIFVFELCMMMIHGATMVLIDSKYAAFPIELLRLLERQSVSFIFWVPTIMVNIANQALLDKVMLDKLRYVWFAGEVFPTKQFNYWYAKLPKAQFSNLYGPIEITLDCTYYIFNSVLDEKDALPIGFPCRNTDILILNDEGQECSSLEHGELCVRGSSLALGYYNDLEKTNQVFVQNPLQKMYPERIYRTGDIVYKREDGAIMFVGRKDNLIKHSGYRIDMGEIEHILINTCKLVKNCCAVYPKNKKRIIMFYESDDEIDKVIFYQELSKYIPKYMIPSEFIRKKILPQNANGKIDRLALLVEAEC